MVEPDTRWLQGRGQAYLQDDFMSLDDQGGEWDQGTASVEEAVYVDHFQVQLYHSNFHFLQRSTEMMNTDWK